MVLLEEVHYIISKPRHVFTDDEGEMTGVYFFIVDYGFDFITSPSCVYHVGEGVLLTCVNSNGHSDVLQRNFGRVALL